MARDLRQTGRLNDYPDRCYYYDSLAVDKNKLKPDAKPLGRFYKKDKVSFQWERITINGVLTSRYQFKGVIETIDHVEDLRPDMYVVDQLGMLFIVASNLVSDDENKSKIIGTRPCITSQITLVGVEKKDG